MRGRERKWLLANWYKLTWPGPAIGTLPKQKRPYTLLMVWFREIDADAWIELGAAL